jgi:hypothetical protein
MSRSKTRDIPCFKALPYSPKPTLMNRNHLLLLLVFLIFNCNKTLTGQSLASQLYDSHEQYREQTIKNRRFKHADIIPLLQKLQPPFQITQVGESIEGRSINLVKYGNGPVKILLWSQMHGDEPTATAAMMDIFNFLSAHDKFTPLRDKWQNKLTLYFIPMLNPDGAERFQRRNALGIDLNRDALRLQCPESEILKRIRDEVDADWGFNLHDQNRYYAAGPNPRTATISFLAPAYNAQKDINFGRANAMKLIAVMNNTLQEYIPGKVAKYSDAFEPRAFGDNIQKWGTSTILIESGALKGDREKQEIRKLNYLMLLTAFESIASEGYERRGVDEYERIPFNNSNAYADLIIREVEIPLNNKWYTVDIAFKNRESNNSRAKEGYYLKGSISDLGDLSVYYAYEELNALGYQAVIGKTYPRTITTVSQLRSLDVWELWTSGFTSVSMPEAPAGIRYANLPIQVLSRNKKASKNILQGQNPGLLIQKNGQTRFVVVNGQLYDIRGEKRKLGDWLR